MLKKSLILVSIFFAIILASNCVFASNMVNSAGNAIKDLGNGIGNTVNNAKNGISNMMNNVEEGTNRVMNGMENGMRDDNSIMGITNGVTDDGYNVTRTGAIGNMTGNGTNTNLVWIILAVAAIAIIALVWYYTMQTTDSHNERR